MNKYYFSKNSIPNIPRCVACIGNFDAVHLGHQELIKKTIELSKRYNILPVVILFSKDPNTILFKTKPLNSLNDRLKLFKKFGINDCIIIECDEDLLHLSYIEFINKYLKKMNIYHLVVGFDFKFGYLNKGNITSLKKSFHNISVVKSINYYGKKISTIRIKDAISSLNYKLAFRMLGYEYKK